MLWKLSGTLQVPSTLTSQSFRHRQAINNWLAHNVPGWHPMNIKLVSNGNEEIELYRPPLYDDILPP